MQLAVGIHSPLNLADHCSVIRKEQFGISQNVFCRVLQLRNTFQKFLALF